MLKDNTVVILAFVGIILLAQPLVVALRTAFYEWLDRRARDREDEEFRKKWGMK